MAAITVDHVEAQIHRALGFLGASSVQCHPERAVTDRREGSALEDAPPPPFQEVVLL